MIRPRTAVLVSLLVGLAAGFFGFGHYLYQAAIGLDESAFPLGPWMDWIGRTFVPDIGMSAAGIALGGLLLLAAGLFAFFFVRASVRAERARTDPGRRSFLTGAASGAGTAVGALALGGLATWVRAFQGLGNGGRGWTDQATKIFVPAPYSHPEPKASWRESRIRAHRRLGRTEWRVSDIVLGTGRIQGEQGTKIAREALARGVNYFDTAPDYSGAGSEQAMGRAIAEVPRESLFVATKFCTPEGHLPAGSPVRRYKEAIEGSLSRLGVEHVDLAHVHSCDSVERLVDENLHTAFEQLRQEGKVRFLGFSSHTPRLVEVANRAIESGRFDVMMLAYHHGIWPEMPEVIRRARAEQDMGVVAMKTLKGAKHRGLSDFQPYADSYSQAALKWSLANEDVSCAVVSFFEPQHVDEFLHASGKPFGEADRTALREYDRLTEGTHCMPHCGACLSSCPYGVPIDDVLRTRMYFEDYGWEKMAIEEYAKLATDASACAGCSAPCLGSCPIGIDIPKRTREAHELLTLG